MTRSLAAVRADFDDVDDALVALIARRQALALEAIAAKRVAGLPVRDPDRERAAQARRADLAAAHGVDRAVVDAVFAVLVDASVAAQHGAPP